MLLGNTLARRFIICKDERDAQIDAFKSVNKTVAPKDLAEWKEAVRVAVRSWNLAEGRGTGGKF